MTRPLASVHHFLPRRNGLDEEKQRKGDVGFLDTYVRQLKLTVEEWRQLLTDDGGFKPQGADTRLLVDLRTERVRGIS